MIYLGIVSSLTLIISSILLVAFTPGFSIRASALSSIVRIPGRLLPFILILSLTFTARIAYLFALLNRLSGSYLSHQYTLLYVIFGFIFVAIFVPVTTSKTFHKFCSVTAFWLSGVWILLLHFIFLPPSLLGISIALLFVAVPPFLKFKTGSWGPAEISIAIIALIWDIFILWTLV